MSENAKQNHMIILLNICHRLALAYVHTLLTDVHLYYCKLQNKEWNAFVMFSCHSSTGFVSAGSWQFIPATAESPRLIGQHQISMRSAATVGVCTTDGHWCVGPGSSICPLLKLSHVEAC